MSTEFHAKHDLLDAEERNALHFCAMGGSAECATMLIETTPKDQLNVGDQRGETVCALCVCCVVLCGV